MRRMEASRVDAMIECFDFVRAALTDGHDILPEPMHPESVQIDMRESKKLNNKQG
jgi:hypothetical protein